MTAGLISITKIADDKVAIAIMTPSPDRLGIKCPGIEFTVDDVDFLERWAGVKAAGREYLPGPIIHVELDMPKSRWARERRLLRDKIELLFLSVAQAMRIDDALGEFRRSPGERLAYTFKSESVT